MDIIMEYILSICIPTWNRAKYLDATIMSIVEQIEDLQFPDVEIVISDNASTDDTSIVIDRIVKQTNCEIVYHRNETNIGADANYVEAVKHARGKYCLLLGSDDILRRASLEKILKHIQSEDTVYVFNRTNCSIDMCEVNEQSFFVPTTLSEKLYSLSNREQWCFYLNDCVTLGGVFSYISGVVFKNEWSSIKDYSKYIGTAYVHVAIILKMLLGNSNSTVKHVNYSLVLNRMGNDSFYINLCQRTMLDFNGYRKISELFIDEDVKRAFLQILHKEHPVLLWPIIVRTTKEEFNSLMNAMEGIYSSPEIDRYKFYRENRISYFTMIALAKILEKTRRLFHK